MELSSRVKGIAESVTLKLNSKAMELSESGKQIYNLTAGQLPFRPPQSFIDAIRSELDFLKSYQYSPVGGFVDLRKKLIEHIESTRGIHFSGLDEPFDCVISNGAKHSISNILGAIINPGDEVIVISPFWISYPEMIKFCRGIPVEVKSSIFDVFTPPLTELKKAITNKTKAIIINSPNNPAGIHYSDEWMQEFAELLIDHPHVCVISDEIYFEVCYYDPRPTYFYQKKPELLKRTVIVDGISKAFASTGLRIGYCVAPKNICQGIENLQGQLTSSANSLIQRAMMNYDFSSSSQFLIPVKNHLRDNANIIREKLKDAHLMKCWYQPVSAFYYMIDFSQTPVFERYAKNRKDKTDYSVQICEDILQELGVVIVPGTDFGMPNSARLSLVLHKEAFTEAMGKLVDFLSAGTK
ncbi:MAG: aminotransferase class I/II-fold pyridoxal phosphate-dependent enzyme [Bacteriovorax sp.]|nr:aminotransferase class I/II-fold pyridoxal phosphate-dependent enzyme [Bacteriovorax sp.]